MSDESTKVAIYDREFLKPREHQPMKEVDGFMITIDQQGQFHAEVYGVEIQTDSLEKAEEKVHRTYMADQKKKRAKVGRGKPCFLFGTQKADGWGRKPLAAHGFFRGVHAGNGDYMFRLPDGSKGQSNDLTLFVPEDPNLERLVSLDAHREALVAELETVKKEIDSIVVPQKKKMLERIKKSYGQSVYIRNDAEKAFEATILILENVFGVKVEEE